jgi:hypothetical protein
MVIEEPPEELQDDEELAHTSSSDRQDDPGQQEQQDDDGDAGDAAASALLTMPAGAMDPDHPLLQRAQRALKQQLESKRRQLEGELKEKRGTLKVREPPGGRCYLEYCCERQLNRISLRPHASVLTPAPPHAPPALIPQRTQQRREAVGVELYGYQQTLARLQLALAKAQESYGDTNGARWGSLHALHAVYAAAHAVHAVHACCMASMRCC